MMKIFLAEDEALALRALEFKLNDLDGPYEVIGTASNGIDALEQLRHLKPDVLIADICMPEMDGIELIEQLSRERPEILTVILSGYQEFDYAKQAMHFGTQDYLLKPVSVDELRLCLEKCAQKLEQRRQSQNIVSFLIGENAYSFAPAEVPGEVGVAYLIISNAMSTLSNMVHPDVPYITCRQMEEFLSERLPGSMDVSCYDGIFSNEKALIFSGSHIAENRIRQLLSGIFPKLEAFCGHYITLYLSCISNADLLSKVIFSCRAEAAGRIILGRTQLCTGPGPREQSWPELQSRAELFLLLTSQGQSSLLRSNIQRLVRDWTAAGRSALSVRNDLLFLLEYFRHNTSCDTSVSSEFLIENLMCFYVDEQDFAENLYQLLIRFPNTGQMSDMLSAAELVENIDSYLQSHLSQPLSLQILADEFGVSKVYLCRIFKKHKNMTPIDYFNRLKIDRAKQLLVEMRDLPLREIASLLGFSDMYYFCKVFKKLTGQTPSQFRTEH